MPVDDRSHQGHRTAGRQWLVYFLLSVAGVLSLFCCFFELGKTFFPLKPASKSCVAKFGPLPSKWKLSSCESPCMNYTDDWKLRILQDGLYLVYAQVAPNTTCQDLAPYEVRLLKNQDIIHVITDKSKIEYVGRSFEFRAEDTIKLIFNSEHQVLKNNSYLGIFLIDHLKFTS
ncbi:tumor necrosis factor ligand superfamily member 18 [Sorex araneus]|uniref:tumor necrosis factor ligand superfamily member 18 n=1 Tax=Sorex araneus TaxID=42254 RepID=UPI00033187D6|nr:tumor necrosis factor ligand superfamily member 18 [Sorex araneus]